MEDQMGRSAPEAAEVIEAITQYQPDNDNWLSLDRLLECLWATGEPEKGIDALFSIFERFPEHDGYGVFWSVLHGLESLPNYEQFLARSLRRQPTHFNVLMARRVLQAGQQSIGGVDGVVLLKEVLLHPQATQQAKKDAEIGVS